MSGLRTSVLESVRTAIHSHTWLAPVREPVRFAARAYRYVSLRGLMPGLGCVAAELMRRDGLVRVDHPTVGGLWLRLGTSDVSVAGKVLLEREYELPLRQAPEVIVDAGAYTGISALWFAARYPNARIVAVEPDLANFALLEQNVSRIPRIHCVREALWSADEPVFLRRAEGGAWATRVGPAGAPADSVSGTTVTTLMQRLHLHRIDLLKIDIEGAELDLFAHGAASWLSSVGAIAVEVHERLHPGARAAILSACREFSARELGHETLFLERDGEADELARRVLDAPPSP